MPENEPPVSLYSVSVQEVFCRRFPEKQNLNPECVEVECHFYFVVQNENVGSGRARSIHILGAGKVAGMRL